jgi:ribosomal protein S18 acetylase RimI-like enzyme
MSAPPLLVELGESDLGDAVSVLARAFRDNPLNRAVIRSRRPARRERANAAGLRAQLPATLGRGRLLGARLQDPEPAPLQGVLVAAPPFGRPLPLPSLGARLRVAWVQGAGVARRWAEVHELLVAHEPAAPHWYLSLLGVRPECQGRGVGRALLDRFLSEVDALGDRAFLETDRPENLGFYGKAGFRTVGELRVFSVPVWLLERSPRRGEY